LSWENSFSSLSGSGFAGVDTGLGGSAAQAAPQTSKKDRTSALRMG
jgi:hypothetical protein